MTNYHRLIYTAFLTIMLQECYAKVGKASNHVTPIYINTVDSVIKASVTSLPEKNPAIGRIYYWYSSNQVCFTNGAYSGKLLHGQYSSYYPNHFLLAQGQFVRGLKDGRWMRWLPNGALLEVVHYKNGLLHGNYETYSPTGQILQRIYYRNGARTGKTKIFSRDGKDSVITSKKNGSKNEERREKNGRNGGQKTKQDEKEDSIVPTKSKRQTIFKKHRKEQDADSAAPKKNAMDSTAERAGKNKMLKSKTNQTDSARGKHKFFPIRKKPDDSTHSRLTQTNSASRNSSSLSERNPSKHFPFSVET